MKQEIQERFICYAKIDTRSDETSETIPSTYSQVEFAKVLMEDLLELGLQEIQYNEKNGYVTATLISNIEEDVPVIGFIAHLDTADFNSVNINPQIHENYNGENIILDEKENIILSTQEFPNLLNYKGQTLITTDGHTLLGSDDKSGIVEIIQAVKYLIENPDIKHGEVRLGFGPDEEIGIGADRFDVEDFGADFAYTVDGGPVGELQYECFNAAQAIIKIQGKNVHPGTAKNKMINALTQAVEIDHRLPHSEVPEHTEGYEGFYHLLGINGTVDSVEMTYIIRDHDYNLFMGRKEKLKEIVESINNSFASEVATIEMKDQYYNMKEIIEKDMTPVDLAQSAMEDLNIEANIAPIRGGTDGSKISYLGLPTPNLFAGGENFHGRYEFVSVEAMEKATLTIAKIIELNGNNTK